jgi:MFS family permease
MSITMRFVRCFLRSIHLGLSGLTWIVNGYVLSFAVLLLTGGRLADSLGRRRLFLTGLALRRKGASRPR